MVSFEDTGVASSGVVMVAGYDGVAQARVSGDIDMVLVSQDASVIMPIRKVGAESGRGSTRESMEGVKDQWVRSRGGAEFVREGSIDEVDEECVGCGDMIGSAG